MKKEGEEAKINENMNFLITLGTPLLFPSHYHHHQQKQRNILRSCDKRRKYEGYIYQVLLVLLTSGKILLRSLEILFIKHKNIHNTSKIIFR